MLKTLKLYNQNKIAYDIFGYNGRLSDIFEDPVNTNIKSV